jgi:hypothetical protein
MLMLALLPPRAGVAVVDPLGHIVSQDRAVLLAPRGVRGGGHGHTPSVG